LQKEAVARLESQLAELKDRHLRLAAEYDTSVSAPRRADRPVGQAQADLLHRLVDALDDLALRHVDPAKPMPKTIHDGVRDGGAQARKELEAIGGPGSTRSGCRSIPTTRGVTTGPARHPAKDHTVGAVLQPASLLGGALIRPARVTVLNWQEGRPARRRCGVAAPAR